MLSAHADVIASEDAPERAGFEFTKSGMPKIHGTCAFRREPQQQSPDEA
jgi:hypothetical protein